MKKIMKKLACASLTAALVVTSLAVAPDTQAAPKVKKIVMNAKSVKLTVGEKYKLKVKKVKPAKASKKVTYKTTKKAVATVTKKGVIKAKAVGTAKIKVTSKVNKKVKATVKVTVTTQPVVSPSVQPTETVQNTQSPVITETPAATAEPSATDTPKPTRTPRPTSVPTTPTPEPTQPPMKEPGAPYELPFVLDGENPNIVPQEDATVEANADGSVTVKVNAQYSGMAFNVPTEMLENNYDTITVYYKNPVNISTGFGCGLWQDPANKDTETVAAWAGVFAAADEGGNILQEGEYTATLGEGNTTTWYINKALFFFNDADSLSTNGPAEVTITKVVFSNSKYTGGEPTTTEEPSNDLDVVMSEDTAVNASWWVSKDNNTYSEDGSVVANIAAGRGVVFFLDKDKAAVNPQDYEKMVVTVSSSQDDTPIRLGVVTNAECNPEGEGNSVIKDGQYNAETANSEAVFEFDLSEISTDMYGVVLALPGTWGWWGTITDDAYSADITIKSIKLIAK